MPRQPRLDAPGTLHHVMGRGIETSKIFISKKDREDFICHHRYSMNPSCWFRWTQGKLPVLGFVG